MNTISVFSKLSRILGLLETAHYTRTLRMRTLRKRAHTRMQLLASLAAVVSLPSDHDDLTLFARTPVH